MIIYNRPEKARRVVEALRAASPRQVYIAADGPHEGSSEDGHRCELARQVLSHIDWPCRIATLFQENNLGCKLGVETAIEWFFSEVQEGVILEDDCLPTSDFLPFCTELLERYRDVTQVMMVGGHNPLGTCSRDDASYLFSRTSPIWGWATWRRAWDHYDPDMDDWSSRQVRAAVRARMPRAEFRVTSRRYRSVYHGRSDDWDCAWSLAMRVAEGVSAIPTSNLVTNIGFDHEATHTKAPWPHEVDVPAPPLAFPLMHPTSTIPDEDYDERQSQHRFPAARRYREMLRSFM